MNGAYENRMSLRRDCLVQVHVTRAERARWRRIAEKEERTLAEVVRDAMRARLAQAGTRSAAAAEVTDADARQHSA